MVLNHPLLLGIQVQNKTDTGLNINMWFLLSYFPNILQYQYLSVP